MKQFQVNKTNLDSTRIVTSDAELPSVSAGEILVRVQKFGFSANNITYAVAGDQLGYWQFFPPMGEDAEGWGVIPVWGFAEVVDSQVDDITVGERFFGYFPPATHLIMEAGDISSRNFFDTSEHRAQLPKGYNLYHRLVAEPESTPMADDLRMLLYPLYVTSFALWDQLKENDWYGAEQIIVVSASSKTSIGLGYALNGDDAAPDTIGITSARNVSFVDGLNIYDSTVAYDDLEASIAQRPTAIVDMAGNADVLGRLHNHLGDNMVRTLNVGLTHWEGQGRDERVNRDRSEFFFAPGRIQKRISDWGLRVFNERSTSFVMETASKSMTWLKLQPVEGIQGLDAVFSSVAQGTIDPSIGLTVEM